MECDLQKIPAGSRNGNLNCHFYRGFYGAQAVGASASHDTSHMRRRYSALSSRHTIQPRSQGLPSQHQGAVGGCKMRDPGNEADTNFTILVPRRAKAPPAKRDRRLWGREWNFTI